MSDDRNVWFAVLASQSFSLHQDVIRVVGFRYLAIYLIVCVLLVSVSDAKSAADSGFENVRVRLVNGSSVRGSIESIATDGSIVGSRILKNVRLEQITSIDAGRDVDSSNGKCRIRLKSGGYLMADEIGFDGDVITVSRGNDDRKIPISVTRAIVWRTSELVSQFSSSPSSEYDYVIVATKRGEQRVKGFLESISETHVSLEYNGKSRKIAVEKVLGVIVADLGDDSNEGPQADVSLIDGSRVVGSITRFQEGILELSLSGSYSMSLDATKIARLTIQSDRIRYLSDLDPVRFEEQTRFVVARPWRRDTSLLGNPIRLKYDSTGRVLNFDKGIGARSYMSIVFRNDNDFDHLRAVIGIDVETAGHGDCEMVIEGDGIRLWSKRVRATDDPEPIKVDILGITEVALIVLPGANFDLADHADWADVRFTKSN